MINSSWTHQSCSWQDWTAKLQAPYSDDNQHKPLHQRCDSISRSNEGLHVVYLWYLLTYDYSRSNFYVMAGLMILLKRNTFNRCGMMVQCTSYISICLVRATCRVHITTLNTQTTTLWRASGGVPIHMYICLSNNESHWSRECLITQLPRWYQGRNAAYATVYGVY